MSDTTLTLSRPLVVVILTELVAIVAVALWQAFEPAREVSYALLLCPLACLEGLYSARLIRAQHLQTPDVWRFRAVEAIGLALAVKLSSAVTSSNFLPTLIRLDMRSAIGGAIVFALWIAVLLTAHDFQELDDPPAPVMAPGDSYVSPLERLTARFFIGGLLIFVAASIMSVWRGLISVVIPATFAYFVIGLLFLPGLRFQMSRREWRSLGIRSDDSMMIPWTRSGLVLVGLAAMIAVLLPTGYLNGLLDFFRSVFETLSMLAAFVGGMLAWLFSLPFRLLTGTSADPKNAPPPPPKLPSVTNPAAPVTSQILDLILKLGLVALILYIVITYFRDHPELWLMLKRLRLMRFLATLWASLRHGIGSIAQGVRLRIPAALPRLIRRQSTSGNPFRFVRLNALSARERVLYFYLSTVRRAEEQGIPRAPTQTPYEYSQTLNPTLPGGHEDLEALTGAFVEARYSRHPVEPTQAKQVQSSWERVKAALRGLKKP